MELLSGSTSVEKFSTTCKTMNYVVVLYFCVVICYVLQINENFIGDLKLLHSTVCLLIILYSNKT